jgi:sulfhydrogenase subunit beta (sulfur reductase)
MKAVSKDKLPALLEELAKEGTLYVPSSATGDMSRFVPWKSDVQVDLEHNTTMSPKDVLFPQTEVLYNYKFGEENTAEPSPPGSEKIIVFGVRPCDVQAIRCLDEVFLTRTYVDSFYKEKRDRLIIISLGCTVAEETCFCKDMGVNPVEAEGADLVMFDLDGEYGFEAKTDQGKEIAKKIDSHLSKTNKKKPQAPSFKLQANSKGIVEKLQKMFEHPIWEEVCQKCIGCGTCAFLCPSCHCFDINCKNTGACDGFRYRTWDACMFNDYALMAGGHDVRPSKVERIRNRYLHKLLFFKERYGMFLCTGCGRCLRECPAGMNIAAFINQLEEVTVDG